MTKYIKTFYRLNYSITAPTLRLIDESGKQLGIVSREEALKKASEAGIDLVEVAAKARPPVCRLIDFKKFQYIQSRKAREEKKKLKEVELKEIRMGPFVASRDLEIRLGRIKDFLTEGHRVKVTVRFAGRQMAHPEFGHELLHKIVEELKEISQVEREAKFEGRNLTLILGKISKKRMEEKNAKNEDQNSRQEKV